MPSGWCMQGLGGLGYPRVLRKVGWLARRCRNARDNSNTRLRGVCNNKLRRALYYIRRLWCGSKMLSCVSKLLRSLAGARVHNTPMLRTSNGGRPPQYRLRGMGDLIMSKLMCVPRMYATQHLMSLCVAFTLWIVIETHTFATLLHPISTRLLNIS